jgi:DNA-binding response OmpR family regulator
MADERPLLLLADDEPGFVLPLRDNLDLEGYRVEVVSDGEEALQKALELKPDLLLLDIMMPKMNGLDVCRELQARGVITPVVILSARDQEVDIVLGLELGADDYITKPFRLRELLARIKAVLRRHQKMKAGEVPCGKPVTIGVAEIDFRRYEVRRKGKKARMTPREFAVLHYLLGRKEEVVSRDELLNEVWGYESYPTTRTVDNHIVRIRRVIEPDPGKPRHLISIRSVGYRLVLE